VFVTSCNAAPNEECIDPHARKRIQLKIMTEMRVVTSRMEQCPHTVDFISNITTYTLETRYVRRTCNIFHILS